MAIKQLGAGDSLIKGSIFRSFVHAFRGLTKLFGSERNARIHLSATVVVVVLGLFFEVSIIEWSLLLLAIGMVMGAEGLNTAIEHVVDLVSPEIREKAGLAKDIAAGGVLITAVCAAIVGLLIFGSKLRVLT